MRLPWGEYLPFTVWLGRKIEDIGSAVARSGYARQTERRLAEHMRAGGYKKVGGKWVKVPYKWKYHPTIMF